MVAAELVAVQLAKIVGVRGADFEEFRNGMPLLAQHAAPVVKRLEPATRAKVLATFAGLIILGIAMMALAWLGAKATRRYMSSGKQKSRTDRPLDPDDWSKKPLDPN
jgi:hypothetical protein